MASGHGDYSSSRSLTERSRSDARTDWFESSPPANTHQFSGGGSSSKVDLFKSSLRSIGGYSVDEKSNYVRGTKHISYIDMRYVPDEDTRTLIVDFDLTIAEDIAQIYTGSNKKGLENFLSWMLDNKEMVKPQCVERCLEKPLEADFVMLKRVLTQIFVSPCYPKESTQFKASYVNGTVYIEGIQSYDYVQNSPSAKWALKFEQYICGEDVRQPAVFNKDYRLVLKSKVGRHSILYSAVTDCADKEYFNEDDIQLDSFIRTRMCTNSLSKERYVQRSGAYLYCDFHLMGISKAVVGFRNKFGHLNRLRLFTQDDFQDRRYFDLAKMIEAAESLLTMVLERTMSSPNKIFKFCKNGRANRHFEWSVNEDDFENLLPEWFVI